MKKQIKQIKWLILFSVMILMNITQVYAGTLINTTTPWIANTSDTMVTNPDTSVTMTRPNISGYRFLLIRLSQTGRGGALSRDLIAGEKITVKIRAKSSSIRSYIYSKFLDFPLTRFAKANEYQDFSFDTTVKSNISSYAWLGLFTNKAGDTVTVKSVEIVKEGSGPTEDTNPPTITLKGANPLTLKIGDTYIEVGATATDDVDGDISASILIDSSAVDTVTAGRYKVTYNISDVKGNKAAEVTRTVNVVRGTLDPTITEVSDQIIYSYSNLIPEYPRVDSGAVIRITNKTFQDHHAVNADGKAITYGVINVFGDGTQTVIVENCKFLNSNVGVFVMNVKKLIVKKSYFEKVGSGIIVSGVKEVDIQYNKIKDFGYYELNKGVPVPWLGVGEAIGIKNTKNFQSLKIQHNLIDNSAGNPENRCEYATAGDFINLIALEMDESKTNDDFIISDNYVVGGGNGGTSSAGGIVYDIMEDDYEDNYVVGTDKLTIANNVLYNTSSYLIGGAGLVGGKIKDNIGYLNQHTDWMLLKSKYSGCVYPPPVRTKMYDYNSASIADAGFAALLRTGGTATRQSIVTYKNNRMYATPYHAKFNANTQKYESGNKDGGYAIANVQSVTDTSTKDAFTLIGDNTFYLNDEGKIVSYEKRFADQYPDKITLLPTEKEVRNLCFGANNKSLFNHVGNTNNYFIESK